MKIHNIKPFENDHEVLQIGDLTIENFLDQVVIYGDLTIRPDHQGLVQAKTLQHFANALVKRLEQGVQTNASQIAADEIDNPFL